MSDITTICQRCDSPLEPDDLRCAICGAAAPRPTDAAAAAATVHVTILRCEGCGAAVSYDATARAPQCAFCAAVLRIEAITDPMEQTERTLRFTVDEGRARTSLRRWLGSLGWFRPGDLRAEARLESLRPLYWVAWVFDAEALISWTADSDAGANRSQWAPHTGQVEMSFDDLVVSASRGLSDAETRRLGPSYDLSIGDDTPPATNRPAGVVIEQFDVQRSMARHRIIQGIDAAAKNRVEAGSIPGHSFRKVQTVALLRRLVTHRCALPAYVLAYRYKDELYRVVISGQDASCIHGAAPRSWAKILLVVMIGVALLALVVFVVASALAR